MITSKEKKERHFCFFQNVEDEFVHVNEDMNKTGTIHVDIYAEPLLSTLTGGVGPILCTVT